MVRIGPTHVLLAIIYVACLLIDPGDVGFDTSRRLQTTHALWTAAPEILPQDSDYRTNYNKNIAIGANGQPHYGYGIAQPLIMLPGDIVAHGLIKIAKPDLPIDSPLYNRLSEIVVSFLIFPVISVLIALVIQRLFLLLGLAYWQANWAVLLGFVTTRLLNASQIYQEVGLHVLCLLTSLVCLLRWAASARQRDLLAASAAFGVLLLIRIVTIIDIAIFASAGFVLAWRPHPAWTLRDVGRAAITLGSGVVAALIIDRLYHHARFGEWTSNYADMYFKRVLAMQAASAAPLRAPFGNPAFPWTTSWYDGLSKAVISPEWGLLWFDDMMILALYLYIRFFRQIGRVIGVLFVATLLHLFAYALFYARYYQPAGWGAWGNRYLEIPDIVLSLLGIVMLVRVWDFQLLFDKAISVLLCAVTIVVQAGSIFFSPILEINQLIDGCGSRWVVVQRFENILTFFTTGRPATSCLEPVDSWEWDPYTFASVLVRQLPAGSGDRDLVWAAWAIGALVLLALLGLLLAMWRRTRRAIMFAVV